MGRVGTGAYDSLQEQYGDQLIGLDIDLDTVSRHVATGRNVIQADVTDDEFWERTGNDKVSVVLLALPEPEQNLGVARGIRSRRTAGHIFAMVQYPEEVAKLKAAGVVITCTLYAEAGNGFADAVIAHFGETLDKEATPPQSPAGA